MYIAAPAFAVTFLASLVHAPATDSDGVISLPLFKAPRFYAKQLLSRLEFPQTTNVSVPWNLLGGDYGYYTSVSVGTPAIEYVVILDTGSSRMWIPSSQCSQCPGTARQFNKNASSTFKLDSSSGREASILYGVGSVAGNPAFETVFWESLTASSMPFLLVSSEDTAMKNALGSFADGILGLGFENGLVGKVDTHDSILYYLSVQNQIETASFSVWFNQSSKSVNDPNIHDGNGGMILLGGVDKKLYNGIFTFLPVVPVVLPLSGGGTSSTNKFWAVKPHSISLGSTTIHAPNFGNAFFDSGSTYITVDAGTYSQLTSGLGFSGLKNANIVSCEASRKFPPINFVLGNSNVSYLLTNDFYIIHPIDGSDNCHLGIQSTSASDAKVTWILGDPFLRSFYTYYDLKNRVVGIATAADGRQPGNGTDISQDSLLAAAAAGPSPTTTKTTTCTTKPDSKAQDDPAEDSETGTICEEYHAFHGLSGLWNAVCDSDDDDSETRTATKRYTRRQLLRILFSVPIQEFAAYGVHVFASPADGLLLRMSHKSLHAARTLIQDARFRRVAACLFNMTATRVGGGDGAAFAPALGSAARRVRATPNAGGDSAVSEWLSVEVLTRTLFRGGDDVEEVAVLATEMEARYFPSGGSMTDYVVGWGGVAVSVSVTRAFEGGGGGERGKGFTCVMAARLLGKKLAGVQNARRTLYAPVRGVDCAWILHVFVPNGRVAKTVRLAWLKAPNHLKQGVSVVVTIWKEDALYVRTR
ncbi:aspartic peptidase domain-containing protein [Chytriomyces sp. MP71]|nr:aspartic peptidase domain-containing protein [Chytriomyces sp. MP71]